MRLYLQEQSDFELMEVPLMTSWDIKKEYRSLYAPRTVDVQIVDVPAFPFVMIDGSGDPNTSPAYAIAVQTLYAVSYAIRAICKAELGRVHTVSPLEGLWHADDWSAFANNERDAWKWTMMIAQPVWVDPALFTRSLERISGKIDLLPDSLRFERFFEGLSVQLLHVGPYTAEAETIARIHREFIPEHGLKERGFHHEIYLSDSRKTPAEKLKTILRQPVDRLDEPAKSRFDEA